MTISAAGILFTAPDKSALFLLRGDGGDFPRQWCLPGGKIEDGETAEQAAEREAIEECGAIPDGVQTFLTRSQAVSSGVAPNGATNEPGQAVAGETVDFTTYHRRVAEQFEPTVSGEHIGYCWAPIDAPPQPLHPGVAISLARLDMDELGVARAIAAGQLTSPQRVGSMTLYAMRVSGTGVAYRRGIDEFVWRDPAIYLSPDMIARCAGLPVVLEHPQKNTLDSQEFNDRIVGTVMFAYVKGDELWSIARIYDDGVIAMMEDEQLSTSPGVVFNDPRRTNSKMKLDDGSTLLIEGKPSTLDHLAICQKGVWDKGGEASGIAAEVRKDSDVTDEEMKAAADKARKDAEETEAKAKADAEKEEKAKADADAGEKLDKVLAALDSLGKRMDSVEASEKARADSAKKDADGDGAEGTKGGEEDRREGKAEKLVADSKKDGEECEADKKAKADAEEKEKARMDADIAKRIADVEARLPMQMSDADFAALADAQAKADAVFSAFGDSAPRPLNGETLLAYRRRLATKLKGHSGAWKPVDLSTLNSSAAFDVAEAQIYKDALDAARNPADLPHGELREIQKFDRVTGRTMREFVGSPSSWMSQFSSGKARAKLNMRNSA